LLELLSSDHIPEEKHLGRMACHIFSSSLQLDLQQPYKKVYYLYLSNLNLISSSLVLTTRKVSLLIMISNYLELLIFSFSQKVAALRNNLRSMLLYLEMTS